MPLSLGLGLGLSAMAGGGRLLTFTSTAATITPGITLSAGAPAVLWTVTESDGAKFTYNTASFTHNRVTAGDYTFTLNPAVYGYVIELDSNTDGLKGLFTAADLALLPNLQQLVLNSNAALNCNLSLAQLPASMMHLNLYDTGGVITGTLANLPANMVFLALYCPASTITGGVIPLAAKGIDSIYLYSMAMTQAQVDDVISRLYTDRALFTAAAPLLQIQGTNQAPSGVYQATVPPVTGKEKIYTLVNDNSAEGFKKWTITYTA